MKADKLILVSLIFLVTTLAANDFSEINNLIENQKYAAALKAMEQENLSNITKKRLLARLAKQWHHLPRREQARFDVLVDDLLPADQTFIEKIKERSFQKSVKEKEEEEEEEFEPEPTRAPVIQRQEVPQHVAPRRVEPKYAPQRVAPPTPKKEMPKKEAPTKTVRAPKQAPQKKEARVAPAKKRVPVKETAAPQEHKRPTLKNIRQSVPLVKPKPVEEIKTTPAKQGEVIEEMKVNEEL